MALPCTSKTSAGWLGQLSPPREMEVSIRLDCLQSLGRPPKTPAISADLRQPLLWIANPLEIPLTMIFSEHFPFSPPSPAPSQRIFRAGLSLEIEICATQYIGTVLLTDLGAMQATESYLTYFPSQRLTALPARLSV